MTSPNNLFFHHRCHVLSPSLRRVNSPTNRYPTMQERL